MGAQLQLPGYQRNFLKGKAHGLNPVVHIGDIGLSPSVIKALDDALTSHELIKVKMRQPEDKKGMAQKLADETGAALCGLVGHVVILYRPHPEKPVIALPTREVQGED